MVSQEFHSTVPLYAGEDGCHIICRAPAILKNIQAQFAGRVDIGVEHLAYELDSRRLVGILLFKMHHEPKGSIFERGIGRPDNNGIPGAISTVVSGGTERGGGK